MSTKSSGDEHVRLGMCFLGAEFHDRKSLLVFQRLLSPYLLGDIVYKFQGRHVEKEESRAFIMMGPGL